MPEYRFQEFFAGSGLVSYGLRGLFSSVWSNDISGRKAAVYRANFGSDTFHLGDIRDASGADIPAANLSWASFPCQDLSLAGSIGGIHAERSGLVWEWLRVIDEMHERPKVLAAENVTGLISSRGGDDYRALHQALAERGYDAGAIVLNADLFVPQSRPRVFVIAVDKSVEIPSSLVGDGPNWMSTPANSRLGLSIDGWIWWNAERPEPSVETIDGIVDELAPFDRDDVVRLIPKRHLEKFERSGRTYATGYRRTRNGKQCLEIRCDGIAGCLRTPAGGSSKQYLLKRGDDGIHARLLTTREVARLMGAPDDFVLPGNYNDGYYAMGDAVAAPVAEWLGKNILEPLVEAAYGK